MNEQLKLTALTPEDLVKVLVRSGCRIMTLDLLKQDIDAGLPTNANGTINLLTYAAWTIKEMNSHGNESGTTQTD